MIAAVIEIAIVAVIAAAVVAEAWIAVIATATRVVIECAVDETAAEAVVVSDETVEEDHRVTIATGTEMIVGGMMSLLAVGDDVIAETVGARAIKIVMLKVRRATIQKARLRLKACKTIKAWIEKKR